ncbi:hypothetical protein Tco_0842000 [Tanacetum coccineum]|uniref:Uncharacterized protein n=1 Tax=Tanacetum coccineum TaxID=301880 RepID=A0ABQ5AZB1_9ASTR
MSQLQSESRVAQSLLCLLRKRLKSGPEDYNGLTPLSYRGADVFILALSLISIASYVNIPKKNTSREAAKYVANGGIIGVVSTATVEPVVVNFARGYFGFKLDERLKIRSNGMLLASCAGDYSLLRPEINVIEAKIISGGNTGRIYAIPRMVITQDTQMPFKLNRQHLIMEYLVNISKRRAFWSLNEDILKINDSDYQYAVSIKEDAAYPCLHSPKTTKETSSIRRIQRRPIHRIEDIVYEDSGRYQAWSLLQETPNTPLSLMLTLAPKSAKALLKSNLPIEQGRIKLPRSFSFGGNWLRRRAEHL